MRDIIKKGGKVGAFHVQQHQFTRSELEHWVATAVKNGAKGLLWIRFNEQGQAESPTAKYLPQNFLQKVQELLPSARPGDTLFMIAAPYNDAWTQLGRFTTTIGRSIGHDIQKSI